MLDNKYISKFYSFLGCSSEEIISQLNIKINPKSKNLYSRLTKEILGLKYVDDLKKEGYVLKSVRLKSNLSPIEAISFPAFHYEKIANSEWVKSDLYIQLNRKYLFIFYSKDNYSFKLNCIREWQIQKQDLENVKNTWLIVKEIINSGSIVKEIKRGKRITNFPKSSKNGIVHVRPHGRNLNDTFKLPIRDKKTKLENYTKHSFWLNKDFIKNKILIND